MTSDDDERGTRAHPKAERIDEAGFADALGLAPCGERCGRPRDRCPRARFLAGIVEALDAYFGEDDCRKLDRERYEALRKELKLRRALARLLGTEKPVNPAPRRAGRKYEEARAALIRILWRGCKAAAPGAKFVRLREIVTQALKAIQALEEKGTHISEDGVVSAIRRSLATAPFSEDVANRQARANVEALLVP